MDTKSVLKHILKLPQKGLIFGLVCLLLGMALFLVANSRTSYAANPNLINFQGKVVNGTGAANPGTNITDGSYTFRFCLYTTTTPTTPCSAIANNDAVWKESKSLTITNGVFQTELGDTTTMIDVSAYTNLYLGVNFNGDAAGEMTPRIHLDSVPYALNSDKLGGLTSSGYIQNTASVQSSSNFNISGTGIAGTALQAPILQTGSGDLALQPATGIVSLNKASTNNELRVYENTASPANYASISYDNATTSAIFKASTGTTKIGNGVGNITLNAGAASAVNITGHAASTWQTDAGGITIQGGTTLSLLSTTSSAASLDSGTTGAVQIGTGANGKAITIGSTTAGTTVSILGGTTANTAVSISTSGAGGVTIDSGTTGNVNVGTGASAKAVAVGNTTAGSTLTLQGGNTANTAISLTTNTSGGITIDTGTTGNIFIGNNANAKAVAIGNSTNGTTLTSTAGAVTEALSNSGDAIKTNTNSATAFAIQNSGGISLVNVDTLTNNSNNIVTNPSFETATMWTNKNGSGTSITSQASTPVYDGVKSMQVTTSGTATNAGASFSTALTLNATYVLSLYVKANATNFSTFEMGYTNTGGDNNCFSADQAVTLSGWTRMTCSFTVTTTAGTAIYVKQTDATGRTFFIDAVLLETDANASGYYENGQISLQGTVNTPFILQNTSNSANAFLVQNSSGSNIFGVDTTDTNLVNNPGVEVNTVNWALKGSAGIVISRDTSNSYLGYAGLKVVTTAVAQDGAKFTFPNNTTLLPNTTYALSFYAKMTGGPILTLSFGRSDTGIAGGETSCITNGTLNTTWQRYSCSFTTGATMGASGNPYIYISQGTTNTIQTFWVDAVTVEPGATATPYGAGSIYLNGVVNSPVNFQNKTDSTTAFQIENASNSITLFGVDTANTIISLGATGTTAVASTVNIANTSGNAAQAVALGSASNTGNTVTIEGGTAATAIQIGNGNTTHGIQIGANGGASANNAIAIGAAGNASSTLTLEAGTGTGSIAIGNGTTAHNIKIGAGGAAGGNTEVVTLGSASTTVASDVILQAGNGATSGSTFIGVNVGSSAADANAVLFQLDSFNGNFGTGVDVASACTTTLNQGTLYYSATSNAVRGCVNGAWEDMVSTGVLGLQLFGVVADSGTNAGDLAGVTSLVNGPCEVHIGAATTGIAWNSCVAFSGGRKVIVTAGTTTATNAIAGQFQHLCLTGTNNQPVLSTAGSETATLSTVSFPSATSPILCLADIKFAAGNNTITDVYDTRTFTTSTHELATVITNAGALGHLVVQGTTTPGSVTPGVTLQGGSVVGVIAASTGTTSTNTVNAVISIGGPAWVKAITETGNAVSNTVQATATTGYAGAFSAPTTTNVYSVLGLARTAWTGATACAINSNACQGSVLVNVAPR